MGRLAILFVILFMAFSAGCESSGQDRDLAQSETGPQNGISNTSMAREQTEETEQIGNPAAETETAGKGQTKEETTYTANDLIGDLKEDLGLDYYSFSKDPSYPGFIRSSDLKYYVIQTLSNKATHWNFFAGWQLQKECYCYILDGFGDSPFKK